MKNNRKKEKALSHDALVEAPKFYQGVNPGRSMESVEPNHSFNGPNMSRDLSDENELDAMLVQSGVDDVEGEENKTKKESDLFLDQVEDEEDEEDLDGDQDEAISHEDELELSNLPHRTPLGAERNL